MGNGDLAVLMTALLLIGDLILDLNRTGTRLDHLAREKISRLLVTKTCVDICNDRHHMGLKLVDLIGNALHLHLVTASLCRIQGAE